MGLTQPSMNYASSLIRVAHAAFSKDENESASPYIELQIMNGRGTGGANDVKGYEYYFFEIYRWAQNGKRHAQINGTRDEVRAWFDKCNDYASSLKVLKQIEEATQ